MSSIKVLEVIRQGQIGGGESHLLDLISGFGEDIQPVVLSFTGGQMIDTLKERGVPCYVVDSSYPFDFRTFNKVRNIVKAERIELIHAHGTRAASNVALIAKSLGIPLVYTVHGWSFHQDQRPIIKSLRSYSEKLLCHMSRMVICVSKSNQISGQEMFGLNRSVVIENGINLQRFNPSNLYKDIRQEYGISKEDFLVGFIGRVTGQKDPLSYVKAVALAHTKEPAIKGLLVGDGDFKKEVTAYIEDHSLNGIFYTSGYRTDIPDLLNAIDLFCLPSLWEGLSISLLEAMSMGCPLVVTPTDGTRELITDHVNGRIAPFGNPEALARIFLEYFEDPESRMKHGAEASRDVKKRFDSQRVSVQVAGIYKSIIASPAR